MLIWPDKDPDDVQDYGIEWASELSDGDAIATSEWIAPADIQTSRDSIDGTLVKVWLSGGVDRHAYRITNRITTTAGRQLDRSVRIVVAEQ